MKAWQIDLSKYARNAGDTERSSVYLGKVTRNKDGLQFNGNYFVDGAILTNRDLRKIGVTKKQKQSCLLKVDVNKNDLRNYDYHGVRQKVMEYGKKPKLIERNYKPNRFNYYRYNEIEK